MEQIKKFLRSRGFTLALLACLVAAAAAGVWAVRTVRDELKKSYDDLTTPQEEPAPEPQLTLAAAAALLRERCGEKPVLLATHDREAIRLLGWPVVELENA